MSHTPAPLYYAHKGTDGIIVEGDGTTVAIISVLENSTAHSALESNLTLWAKAPALLEALEWALSQIEDSLDPDHQAAFEAAKAAAQAARWRSCT